MTHSGCIKGVVQNVGHWTSFQSEPVCYFILSFIFYFILSFWCIVLCVGTGSGPEKNCGNLDCPRWQCISALYVCMYVYVCAIYISFIIIIISSPLQTCYLSLETGFNRFHSVHLVVEIAGARLVQVDGFC